MPSEVTALNGPFTRTIDLRGAWLTPGLRDAHVHLEGSALVGQIPILSSVRSDEELKRALAPHSSFVPPGGWMWGFGISGSWAKGLSSSALERLLPGVPLWLSASDGHSAVLSDALINRLPASLRATVKAKNGRIREALARRAWFSHPPPAGERLKPFVVRTLNAWVRHGITEVDVMGARLELVNLLKELNSEGRLPLEVRVYLAWPSPAVKRWLSQRLATPRVKRPGPDKGKVRVVGMKVWLDGTLGSRTAALSAPYADAEKTKGDLYVEDDELRELLVRLDALGLQLAAHAIGDRAVDQLIAAHSARGQSKPPIRVEHVQVVRPDQLPGLKGMVCSVQPAHRLQDAPWAAERLGAARRGWGYRAQSLRRRCPLVLGSDAPVSAVNPALMTDALRGAAGERLSTRQALSALQRDPMDPHTERLSRGQPANFTLWSADPSDEGTKAKVLGTVVHGVLRWLQ